MGWSAWFLIAALVVALWAVDGRLNDARRDIEALKGEVCLHFWREHSTTDHHLPLCKGFAA